MNVVLVAYLVVLSHVVLQVTAGTGLCDNDACNAAMCRRFDCDICTCSNEHCKESPCDPGHRCMMRRKRCDVDDGGPCDFSEPSCEPNESMSTIWGPEPLGLTELTTQKPYTENTIAATTENPGTENIIAITTENPGTENNIATKAENPGTENTIATTTENPGTENNIATTTENPDTGNNIATTTENPDTENTIATKAENPGTESTMATAPEFTGALGLVGPDTNTTCLNGVVCSGNFCEPVSDPNGCQSCQCPTFTCVNLTCPAGYSCEMIRIRRCLVAPCFPDPVCIRSEATTASEIPVTENPWCRQYECGGYYCRRVGCKNCYCINTTCQNFTCPTGNRCVLRYSNCNDGPPCFLEPRCESDVSNMVSETHVIPQWCEDNDECDGESCRRMKCKDCVCPYRKCYDSSCDFEQQCIMRKTECGDPTCFMEPECQSITTTENPDTENTTKTTIAFPRPEGLIEPTTENPDTENTIATTTENPDAGNNIATTTENPDTGNTIATTTENPGTENTIATTTENPDTENTMATTPENPDTGNNIATKAQNPGTENNIATTTENPDTENTIETTTENPDSENTIATTTENPDTENTIATTTENPDTEDTIATTPEFLGVLGIIEPFTEVPDTDSCLNADVLCSGDFCERVVDENGCYSCQCPPLTCANIKCSFGYTCVMKKILQCKMPPCFPTPVCEPKRTISSATKCLVFIHCPGKCEPAMDDQGCYTCDCPKDTCADVTCAEDEKCIMKNRPKCVKKNGDAIECRVCHNWCPRGHASDDRGCPTCRCKNGPVPDTKCPRSVRCNDRQDCRRQKITCFQAPCSPLPTCRPSKVCPKVKCSPSCKTSIGRDGCPTCVCPKTCEQLRCKDTEVCELLKVECSSPPCSPISLPACIPKTKMCDGTPNAERCFKKGVYATMWRYNSTTKFCSKFRYYGCTPSPSTFSSWSQCATACVRPCPSQRCAKKKCYETPRRAGKCPRCVCPCKGVECPQDYVCRWNRTECLEWPCDDPEPYCVLPPVCRPPVCDLVCDLGFARDENGCEICQCLEPHD